MKKKKKKINKQQQKKKKSKNKTDSYARQATPVIFIRDTGVINMFKINV